VGGVETFTTLLFAFIWLGGDVSHRFFRVSMSTVTVTEELVAMLLSLKYAK
jgi:hypothetical protein